MELRGDAQILVLQARSCRGTGSWAGSWRRWRSGQPCARWWRGCCSPTPPAGRRQQSLYSWYTLRPFKPREYLSCHDAHTKKPRPDLRRHFNWRSSCLGLHAHQAWHHVQVESMQLPMDMQQQSPGAPALPGAVPVTPGCGAHTCTPAQHLLARSTGMAPSHPIVSQRMRFATTACCSHVQNAVYDYT